MQLGVSMNLGTATKQDRLSGFGLCRISGDVTGDAHRISVALGSAMHPRLFLVITLHGTASEAFPGIIQSFSEGLSASRTVSLKPKFGR